MSTTITDLPNATTPLSGTERVPMDQSGATKDATTQDIANLAPGTDLSYTAATRVLTSSTGTDATLPLATGSDAGLMAAADKTKLDNITVDTATVVRKLVRNTSGVSIAKGQPVYQTGSSGTTITVALADASAEATASQTLGLAQEAIADNATGFVIAVGELTGVNTATLTEGQIVWLGETTGGLTTTRPTQPAHGVVLGYCVKQGAGASGIVYVKVDNGLELNELHDVLITSPSTGQVVRRAADGLWKNATLAAADVSGLGTAAPLDVAAAGDATTGQVVKGNDSRLTDSRTPTAHTQAASTISDSTAAGRALLTAADAAAQRSSLGLGTAATANTGTSAGNVVALDGSGKLPAVDGSALTGINATTDLGYTAATRVLTSSTGTDVTLPLFDTASSNAGLVPGSSTGGTSNFLRADGTWAAPPSSPPGGSTTQIQFNDSGAFGGDADLTYNKTTNLLTTKGDINLDDGGSFTTTLQTITPTANRTLSLPDATGTVALVAGSSGQLLWNNSGANAGASTLTYDGSILTTSGRFINSYNATASSPAKAFTGTWFTGGTATTTKPHVLVEPTGTTSTAWSTSGTGIGVNAPSGFTGNLLDLQVNGTSAFRVVSSLGALLYGGSQPALQLGSNAFDDRVGVTAASGLPIVSIGGAYLTGEGANQTVLAQRRGTNPQTFRVYNTYTSGTNYELGKLEWSSNVFRIGTEKGSGGGTARAVEVHTDSVSRLALDTTGSVRVVTGLTVATLPGTPAVGMIARVTDATAPAVGSAVTGGGSAAALVWYNGTAWNVIGV